MDRHAATARAHDVTPDPTLEPLLSVDELATYLGMPKQTIYDWRVNGRGPRAYRIGKHLRFAVSDVRDWVAAQREPAAPATPPRRW